MKIALGSDHQGVALKQVVALVLQELGHEAVDMGCYDTSSVDYPDIAQAVAQAVAGGQVQQGVLVCATGIGMSIAANKAPGVRAALCHDVFSACRAREHNDANVLCLGGQVTGPGLAQEIARAFFTSTFQGGRHARRVAKIEALERAPTP